MESPFFNIELIDISPQSSFFVFLLWWDLNRCQTFAYHFHLLSSSYILFLPISIVGFCQNSTINLSFLLDFCESSLFVTSPSPCFWLLVNRCHFAPCWCWNTASLPAPKPDLPVRVQVRVLILGHPTSFLILRDIRGFFWRDHEVDLWRRFFGWCFANINSSRTYRFMTLYACRSTRAPDTSCQGSAYFPLFFLQILRVHVRRASVPPSWGSFPIPSTGVCAELHISSDFALSPRGAVDFCESSLFVTSPSPCFWLLVNRCHFAPRWC